MNMEPSRNHLNILVLLPIELSFQYRTILTTSAEINVRVFGDLYSLFTYHSRAGRVGQYESVKKP